MAKRKKQPVADVIADTAVVGAEWEPSDTPQVSSDLTDLASGRQVVPNPLDAVRPTGNAEADSLVELAALQSGFAARAKQEQERVQQTTDSEYWFCVCFQTRDQKEAFLEAMGWLEQGDKYLDGVELARRAGIALPSSQVRFVSAKPDKALNELALPLED